MRTRWAQPLRGLLLLSVMGLCAGASQIDVYNFNSDEQRARYKSLIDEFRCPKCLNTNISGSDAPIAQDLRRTVHRLVVVDGYTDQQVRDFLQARYGDFVLYDTPFNERTWLVWMVPITLLLVGLVVLLALLRRGRGSEEATALSAADRTALQQILVQDGQSGNPSDDTRGAESKSQ